MLTIRVSVDTRFYNVLFSFSQTSQLIIVFTATLKFVAPVYVT